MAGLLLFSAVPLLAWVFWTAMAQPDWRVAAVRAAVVWAAGTSLFTELLSAFHLLRFWPVLGFWLTVNVAMVVWLVRRPARIIGSIPGESWRHFSAGLVLLLAVLALVIAAVAPPNTPDVLAYHLPRQMFWLQQGSLQHFVTLDERALMMPPLAEVIQTHALLLSGGDHWANLPQWLAYVLGMVVTSLLARELGGGRRTQWLAVLIFATIPMAWHEATSAKNDLLVAVWLGAAGWHALRMANAVATKSTDWIELGAALGIALATKTTALIFVLPILAVIGAVAWRDRTRAWIAAVLILVIVGPHAARNQAWYGTPLGRQPAEQGGGQANESVSFGTVTSNLLRNATLHLATPSPALNDRLRRWTESILRRIGQDPNDRRTTLWFLRYGIDWGPEHEAIAGAPAHFLLGIGVLLLILLRRAWRGPPGRVLLLVVGGTLLGALVLKWQPTGARLQLPVFLVLAALIAWAAERLGRAAMVAVAGGCVLAWLPSSETQLRPWHTAPTLFATSRWENYFRFHPRLRLDFEQSLGALAKVRPASLQIVSRHGFPYPLLQRLREELPETRLWGTLPEALAQPPSAILVVEPEANFPAEYRPPGSAVSYRAVGGLTAQRLYLPVAAEQPAL